MECWPPAACGLWGGLRGVPGLRSGPDKVQSCPAAQTIWLIALRRPKSTSLSSGNLLAAAEHSPKPGDRPQVASSYCPCPGVALQASLLLVDIPPFILELLASGFVSEDSKRDWQGKFNELTRPLSNKRKQYEKVKNCLLRLTLS